MFPVSLFTLVLLCVWGACLGLPASGAAQSAAGASRHPSSASPFALRAAALHRMEGFFWDVQGQGGGGVGFANPPIGLFMLQVRLGGMWASDPHVWSGGVVGQAGGLAGLGLGAELAFNELSGFFGAAGATVSREGYAILHGTVGYRLLGVHLQQRLASARAGQPGTALLAVLRLPIGLWLAAEKASKKVVALAPPSLSSQAASAQPAQPRAAAAALARARKAEEEGRLAAAEAALNQAYELDPERARLLDLARVRQARGRLIAASDALAAYLRAPEASRKTADLQTRALRARLGALRSAIALVRIAVTKTSGTMRFQIDGNPCVGVRQGYDCPVDPGHHRLVMKCGSKIVFERSFEASQGELIRVKAPLCPGP